MMVVDYCNNGDLSNYLRTTDYIDYGSKIFIMFQIARGLLDIHNAGKVHKDFHPGNILINKDGYGFISNLATCQPANKSPVKEESITGALPYTAPEVIRGHQY